jgi:hypothetical protein
MLSIWLKGSNFQAGVKISSIAYSIVAYALCILLTFMDKLSCIAVTLLPLVANALYGFEAAPGRAQAERHSRYEESSCSLVLAIITSLLPASYMIDKISTVALALLFHPMNKAELLA